MNTKKSKKKSQAKEIWRRFKKNKTAMVGLVLLVLIILMAVFADLIVPYSECLAMNNADRLQAPNAAHWFGTDDLGRDLFARIVHGSRYSLAIGVSGCVLSMIFGGILGAISAYYGNRVDQIIMRLCDVVMTLPPILLSLAVVAALGTNMRNLMIAITVANIPSWARMVRSTVLTVADQDYIEAAKSYGASDKRTILKYILPNAMGPIIVTLTMGIASGILGASGLSFLGMGVQPPAPEWGVILSDAREYMFDAAYMLYIPGLFIIITALAFNLAGDGLRDAMDPKLKD